MDIRFVQWKHKVLREYPRSRNYYEFFKISASIKNKRRQITQDIYLVFPIPDNSRTDIHVVHA
jgi:hypothetical protein